jgi:hypothetical protein
VRASGNAYLSLEVPVSASRSRSMHENESASAHRKRKEFGVNENDRHVLHVDDPSAHDRRHANENGHASGYAHPAYSRISTVIRCANT